MGTTGLRIVQSEEKVTVMCGDQTIWSEAKTTAGKATFKSEVSGLGTVEGIIYWGLSPLIVLGAMPEDHGLQGFDIVCDKPSGTFRLVVACFSDEGFYPVAEADVVRDHIIKFPKTG